MSKRPSDQDIDGQSHKRLRADLLNSNSTIVSCIQSSSCSSDAPNASDSGDQERREQDASNQTPQLPEQDWQRAHPQHRPEHAKQPEREQEREQERERERERRMLEFQEQRLVLQRRAERAERKCVALQEELDHAKHSSITHVSSAASSGEMFMSRFAPQAHVYVVEGHTRAAIYGIDVQSLYLTGPVFTARSKAFAWCRRWEGSADIASGSGHAARVTWKVVERQLNPYQFNSAVYGRHRCPNVFESDPLDDESATTPTPTLTPRTAVQELGQDSSASLDACSEMSSATATAESDDDCCLASSSDSDSGCSDASSANFSFSLSAVSRMQRM